MINKEILKLKKELIEIIRKKIKEFEDYAESKEILGGLIK